MQFTRRVSYEMETEEPSAKRFKQDGTDIKLERSVGFSISTQGPDTLAKKGKSIRDATSHRIIEKRRRDRMNNCLADLNNLMPSHYWKEGQGRIEKTEIIEMAIKLIKSLQSYVEKNESAKGQDPMCLTPLGENAKPCCISKFYMGFKECQDEVMRFLVETEDNNMSDQVCVCMMDYLGKAADKFLPTGTNIKQDTDSNSATPYSTGMTSHDSYDSSSPSSADENASNKISENSRCMTSDSGFTNMDSAFSSMSLPLRKFQTEQFSTNAAQNTYASYERSNTSSYSGQGAYKFKHNITQRFSLQEQKVQHSDTSSSCSHEEQNIQLARQSILNKMLSNYTQDSTPYPSSNDDNYTQSAVQNSMKLSEEKALQASETNDGLCLPAFVLHPSGSHYFPISIHPTNVPQSSLSSDESPAVNFHTVSIPVRFSGPCVPLRTDIQHSE